MIAAISLLLLVADPAGAIARGRQQIAANDCNAAVGTLQAAIPDAVAIPDAISAIHFYTALAFSNCSMPAKAKEQLREFFRLRPGHSALDAAKYPTEFLDLFNEVQRALAAGHGFERFYPGFNEYADFVEEPVPLSIWTTSPAFQLFADDEERAAWGLLHDDIGRSGYIQRFWSHRDRGLILRRIEFADRFFTAPDEMRGSMTDRGRVFILLGPPARVHRKGLQRYETTIVNQRLRTPLTGTLERWVYFKPQLPGAVPAQQVEFRFITQPGYGQHVMQRDFWPLKALSEARRGPARSGD